METGTLRVALHRFRHRFGELLRRITRFEAERQVLALMDHPNIARVFDAGVTGRGRPFFVMELVGGEPFTLEREVNRR